MMTDFATDTVMAYDDDAKRYTGSEPLFFDERYRTAQLPLVAPNHPLCLNQAQYAHGKRPLSRSLVLPIDGESLWESPDFLSFVQRLKEASFGEKIAWEMEKNRRAKLHGTLAGGLHNRPPEKLAAELDRLSLDGAAFRFQLKRPFVGTFNTGRLYLCVYPEVVKGLRTLDAFSTGLGGGHVRKVFCGLFNLTDELSADEALALQCILDDFADTVFDVQPCTRLALIDAYDDLVLDGSVIQNIPLEE